MIEELEEARKWLSIMANISIKTNEIEMLKQASFWGGGFSIIKLLIEANKITFEDALEIKEISDKFASVQEAIEKSIDFLNTQNEEK
jgi:hypothetical protein